MARVVTVRQPETVVVTVQVPEPMVVTHYVGAPGRDGIDGAPGSDGQPGAPTVVNGKTGESIELDAADVGAIPSTAGMWVVEHGDDAGVSRPDAPAVYWIGSVEPVNAVDNDLWIGGM